MAYQAGVQTARLYKNVIDEVINNVREAFTDEGIDEQVLMELKQIWENKVLATKAVDSLSDPPTVASSSSGAQARVHHSSHHQTSGNTGASNHNSGTASVNVNNVQPAQQASVVVATPAAIAATFDAAAAAAAAGFQHLAGQQHIFQTGAGPAAMVANFAAFQPSVITNAGPGLIMGLPTSNIRYINAAQLPTIPAVQLNQNQPRNLDGTRNGNLPQVDGPTGISDDEDDFEDDDDTHEPLDEPADVGGVEEGEPLNSEDDVSNEDAEEMFEADNVVVCQYEKVTRTRNKWKFILKDGIMNLDGKDYAFNRANGEAEF